MQSVDQNEAGADGPPGIPANESPDAPTRLFWPVLLGSIAFQAALIWVLDAIPPRTDEPLVLRWLRALGQHPIRGPLGLALGAIGLAQLVRAVFNRITRT